MRVIIIGAGFTGVQLARALLAEKHRVTLIDPDAERIRDVGSRLDCAVVQAEGNSLEVLEKAGLADAHALIAVSASDEVNMVACALADSLHPEVLKIARVRNYSYYKTVEAAFRKFPEMRSGARRPPFGIDWMLNPDVAVAEAISRTIDHGALGEVLELEGHYGIVSLEIGPKSPLAGRLLRDLPELQLWHYLIAYVEHGEQALLPGGDVRLEAGDRIGVLTSLYDVPAVARICDTGSTSVRRVAVIGAGAVGSLVVANELAKNRPNQELMLIDDDLDLCREAAARFEKVRVICGDMADEDFVREERLDRLDVVVTVSEKYERNLVVAAYMETCGVPREVVLTATSGLTSVAKRLGVEVVVPMRDTIVDTIMSHLRGRNVSSVHTVCSGAFEILESGVEEGAAAVGKTLRNLRLGGHALALLVRRVEGAYEVPNGNTVIHAGERITFIKPVGDRRVLELVSR